jgi:HlyD family secretion protein
MEIVKKIKKTKKRYIFLGLLAIIALFYFIFHNGNGEKPFVLVERGDLVQEIFETGSTEKGENIKVSFTEGGKIEKIFVKEGEIIKSGDVVATVDKRELELSLREAQATLSSARASLNQLLDGATKEQLAVAKAAVTTAENNLNESKKVVAETVKTAYQNIPTLLGDVFNTVKEVEVGIDDLVSEYFSAMVVEETRIGRRSRDKIKEAVEEIEKYKDLTEKETSFLERENATKEVESQLKIIIQELDNFIAVADSDFYTDKFSDADKTVLRGYRTTVNNSLAEVTTALGSLSSTDAGVSAEITIAEGVLDQAQKELSRIKASASSSDVIVREAAIEQALARVALLEKRISDASLRSPTNGTVSAISMQEGEVALPGSIVAVIVPDKKVQIALDIYEGDVSKIKINNDVLASFVAFSEEEFTGKIVSINPTGKVVDNVIYYPIKIVLDNYPENVLPQMTVDITIRTDERNNVLLLPERLIYKKDERQFVKVLEGEEEVEREIKTGLRGEGRIVEVVSGLKEGEKVLE